MDPVTKNVTQVGLLSVVMVLFWYIRNEHSRQRDADKKDLDEEKARSSMLLTIIEKNITAMIGSSSAAVAQKDATERLITTNLDIARHLNEMQIFNREHKERHSS